VSSLGHEWAKHEREGWYVCSRCGMVRNYDREQTTCSGALPKIRQRSEIEDCGQDGVCRLSQGCNRHWEERNRELVRENEVLRSNSDHLSSENASLSRLVELMAMRIESLAEELAKPEDVRLREVLDALDSRFPIFDSIASRVSAALDEAEEFIGRAGEAERMVEAARRSLSSVAEAMTEHAYQELASALESPPRIAGKTADFDPPGREYTVGDALGLRRDR
jgi:predicted HTH domain antitoxin